MEKYRILIVEDDKDLALLTAEFFEQFEFECQIEHDGEVAIQKIEQTSPDLILLDVMLPNMDGLKICQYIKDRFQGKIIILTARTDTIDQVLGLELGADDYVSKPVEPRLLLARARAVLRRSFYKAETNQGVITFNDIEIDKYRREVYKNKQLIDLSSPEYELFSLLVDKRGEVVDRDQIFMRLKGVEYDGQSRQVDIHISNIRAKLDDGSLNTCLIKTIRSRGYMLVER
jgi:two-component system response regulator RstA